MKLQDSILDYWKSYGVTSSDHFYCTKCHKFMPDLSELEIPMYFRENNLFVSYGKKHLKYNESLQNRFLVKGRIFEDKLFFRKLCWDCFHEELEKTIIEKFKKREIKYTWYRKYMRGELKNYYPAFSQSACFYFKFLFGLPDDLLERECQKFVTANLDAYIRKYGDNDIAREKYEEYRKLQAKNGCTLEYFVEKLGEEEGKKKYDEVCQAKAVSKKNCIEKYGIEFGKKLFNDYCSRQAYAGCKEQYFIDKYGEEEGKKKYDEVCHQKALTLANFIRKHGEEQGKIEYERWYNNSASMGYSEISQKLFESIDNELGKFATTSKWFLKNKEEELEIDFPQNDGTTKKRFARPDYMLNSKIIEFNGDYWHLNPKFYGPEDERYYVKDLKIKAKELWDYDSKRNQAIENLGFKVKVVWENDYRENPEQIIKECCEFLKND